METLSGQPYKAAGHGNTIDGACFQMPRCGGLQAAEVGGRATGTQVVACYERQDPWGLPSDPHYCH
jgi:hypothetical protein